jgi:hypothetical protein
MQMAGHAVVEPCSLVDVYRRFRSLLISLMMEVVMKRR